MLPAKLANLLTQRIIACGIQVHKALGPGLLESVYEEALCMELSQARLEFRRQVAVPIYYREQKLGTPLKLDVLVAEEIVLELKAVETILPVHEAQLLSYLRLTGKNIGLLMNFHVPVLKQGIRRKTRDFSI